MKKIQILLEEFMEKLNITMDHNLKENIAEVFVSIEELKKELSSTLAGSARASQRARVKSVELSKQMKVFRQLTVNLLYSNQRL